MTVLGSIVQAPMLPVFNTGDYNLLSGGIAGQFVRHHYPKRYTLLLEQFPEQTLGGFLIAAVLDQDVEHDPVLIDRSPEPVLPTCNADDYLIEVLLVSWCRKTSLDLVSKALAELHCPLANHLMAELDASRL